MAVRAGIVEEEAEVRRYLASELGNKAGDPRLEVFLANGPEMVRFFEAETAVAFVDGNKVPDFHATPGHATGGRSVAAAPYDGRGLGAWIAKLRPPLDIVSVGGMGIASGADLNHFVNATRKVASARHAAGRFLRHGRDLALHRRGMQLVNGNALVARLLRSALDRGVAIRTEAPAEGLVVEGGRVVGARVGGEVVRARRGVVLATGGFPHDAARIAAMFEHPRHHSAAPEGNTGDGMRMGEAVGGVVADDLVHAGAWAPVSLVPRADGSVGRFPHLVERAKPGFIAVDGRGAAVRQRGGQLSRFHGGADAGDGGGGGAGGVADCRCCSAATLGARVGEAVSVSARAIPAVGLSEAGADARGAGAWPAGWSRRRWRRRWRGSTTRARRGEDPDFGRGRVGLQPGAGRRGGDGGRTRRSGRWRRRRSTRCGSWRGASGPSRGCGPTARRGCWGATGRRSRGSSRWATTCRASWAATIPSGGITLGPAMTFGYVAGRVLAGLPVDGLRETERLEETA